MNFVLVPSVLSLLFLRFLCTRVPTFFLRLTFSFPEFLAAGKIRCRSGHFSVMESFVIQSLGSTRIKGFQLHYYGVPYDKIITLYI